MQRGFQANCIARAAVTGHKDRPVGGRIKLKSNTALNVSVVSDYGVRIHFGDSS